MNLLIVDDSILYRSAIQKSLSETEFIKDFKTASNGKVASELAKSYKFDLITLDLEMPVMDGLEAIKAIREFDKNVVILVFSAISTRGAEKTIKALSLGANDFITKVERTDQSQDPIELIKKQLLPRVEAFRKAAILKEEKAKSSASLSPVAKPTPKTSVNLGRTSLPLELRSFYPDLIAIGSSTGGPTALKTLFNSFRTPPQIPIVIVQHMPKFFTATLAAELAKQTGFPFDEAKNNQEILPGHIYIAPGDYHMTVERKEKKKILKLNQGEKVCFVRPSVDVLYHSIAQSNISRVLPVVLTGMGRDGTEGIKSLKKFDGPVIIQDEETSTVWGMPGAIAAEELQTHTLSLEKIAEYLQILSSTKE